VARLNQLIAAEKGVKASTARRVTDLYHLVQRQTPLSGIARTYTPKDDEGDQLPAESTQVQVRAVEVLEQLRSALTRLWDVTASKDATNCEARADVVVDGAVLLADVPTTTLLYLEKQLADLATFVKALPVLDPAEEWVFDDARDCYATVPARTTRTKKIPRNHVLADATEHHPAQVTVWHEDVIVGTWTTVRLSGALPASRVAELLARVTALHDAVRHAREDANCTTARDVKIGKLMLDYVLA
jgi:hypothetical protein